MKLVHYHGGTISWSANIRNVLGSNCFFVASAPPYLAEKVNLGSEISFARAPSLSNPRIWKAGRHSMSLEMRQFHGPRYRRTAQSSAGNESVGSSQRRRHCIALLQDGAECCRLLQRPDYKLCPPHHREYKELCGQYKDAEEHYNRPVEPEIGLEVEG